MPTQRTYRGRHRLCDPETKHRRDVPIIAAQEYAGVSDGISHDFMFPSKPSPVERFALRIQERDCPSQERAVVCALHRRGVLPLRLTAPNANTPMNSPGPAPLRPIRVSAACRTGEQTGGQAAVTPFDRGLRLSLYPTYRGSPVRRKKLRSVVVSVLAVTVAASALHAQVVPAFTQAIGDIRYPINGYQPNRVVKSGVNPAPSSVSDAASGQWGSLYAYAFADLSTGTLKSQSTVVNSQVGSYLYVQSNAFFGDGFRTANPNGSPYTWGPTSSGQFTFNLSGTIAASPSLQLLNSGAFVVLTLFQPGTLDPNLRSAGIPQVLTYYYWQLGNPSLNLSSCGNQICTTLVPTGYLSSFPQTISQTINPGGDFDWSLVIGSYGQPLDQIGSYDLDFSHTLTAAYQGPEGTTTYSQSGVFPSTSPLPATTVPEPATFALFGAGLLVIGVVRRKRGNITANPIVAKL